MARKTGQATTTTTTVRVRTPRRASTARSGSAARRTTEVIYQTPKQQRQQAAQSVIDAGVLRASLGTPTQRKRVQATALDQYVLGMYAPEVDSRGPCMVPQNTFRTTHRFNTVVSNAHPTLPLGDIYLAVGDWWLSPTGGVTTNDTFANNWEASTISEHFGLLQAFCGNGTACNIGYSGVATTTVDTNLFGVTNVSATQQAGQFGTVTTWDSPPVLYAGSPQSPHNPQPRRVVGLKVVVIPVSPEINTAGSIRGGDNGTIALGARVAPISGTDITGLTDPGVTNDVYDAVWPDAYAGFTQFTRDPRIKELGAIERAKKYEFSWIPTSQPQLEFEDEPVGGTWGISLSGTQKTTGTFAVSAFPVNMFRRGPCVFIGLTGLAAAGVAQSFQVRATIAYEHVVTPYGNGNLYDYSRKAPWFPLPWDRMSALPTAGVGVMSTLIAAGRQLEENDSAGMRVGPQPSLARALLSYSGAAEPAVYSMGTVNSNGAPSVIGIGAEASAARAITADKPGILQKLANGAMDVGRGAAHLMQYGVEHATDIQKLMNVFSPKAQSGNPNMLGWASRAGPIIEEVAEEAGPLMIAL